jgi:hypothetical protein
MRRIIIAATIPDDQDRGLSHFDNNDIATWLAGEGLEDPTVWNWKDFWKDVDDGVIGPAGELPTWTFMGHWEGSKIVVEYAVPGDVQDERVDRGHWEGGLWAAPGGGATIEEAEANAKAEYEAEYEEDDG